jgi:poly(3-hydroxybutyrate) depolymerase
MATTLTGCRTSAQDADVFVTAVTPAIAPDRATHGAGEPPSSIRLLEGSAMSDLDRRTVLRGATVTALGAVVARAALDPSSASAAPTAPAARPARRPLGAPGSLDGRPLPDFDRSRANRLPREMTGYWTRSFDLDGGTRTAKVYISPETPIRQYFTVIAVPDGVSTADFLHRSGWRDVADSRGEGLFVLEPGPDGWGEPAAEASYVEEAMRFHQANGYYSIFGEHYLVGYAGGAAPLEWWASVNPLRVISQVHLGSAGLPRDHLDHVGDLEYDGTTEGSYTTVELPEGFRRIRRDEVVLPTWHIAPRRSARPTVDHWLAANDTDRRPRRDRTLGLVHSQRRDSGRWMTSHSGPIAQVAVRERPMRAADRSTTRQIVAFLTFYTRYENFFAYGNQLLVRPDLKRLGVEIGTMTVAGEAREYLVYEPRSARRIWGRKAPVVFVWPGNTQTDRVFFDSAAWWQVADREGCVLVVICETYSASAISVSHRDSDEFFRRLRERVLRRYDVDASRLYSTGQSAGSSVTQTLAIARPEYFAAVASTSFTAAPDEAGQVSLDGVTLPASQRPIPNYQIYGYGDLSFIEGTLWDDIDNRLDGWAAYHLGVNALALDDVDVRDGARSGWHDRFRTWTWHTPGTDVPAVRLTRNEYRSHNNIPEETPMLWEFLRHYRHEVAADGTVRRWYSPSGFRRRDEVEIPA